MSKFKDKEGREYTLSLNVTSARKVKTETGIDLLDFESMLGKLSDTYVLFDVLWALIERTDQVDGGSVQVVQNDVTPETFGTAMAGDPIEEATEALLQMVIDFFPERRREVLNNVLTKTKSLSGAMLDHAAAQVEKLTLGDLSGPVPESSG